MTFDNLETAQTLSMRNDLTEIELISEQVSTFGEELGMSSKSLFEISLALDELLTNIISYGYQDQNEHQILIRLQAGPGSLIIRIEDDASPFNPLAKEDPDVTKPLEERTPGGLGIYLVRKTMNELEYQRENGLNILTMTKSI
jgi:anti-sigma regulatory factor (Ser/Thr protein kinase)